jgi:integrase
MPTPRKAIVVTCRYAEWKLPIREGVFQADGRSNKLNFGRHSLGTRDETEARQLVHELDEVMAAKLGLIESKPVTPKSGLTISDAIARFRKHKSRPISVGGVSPSTLQRYDRILNKFEPFTKEKNVKYMTQVNVDLFDEYVAMLEEMDFSPTTIPTEMVLLKGIHKFCIDEKLLDPRFSFLYPVKRPGESLTFCPSEKEVAEILLLCKTREDLLWLYRIVFLLSRTGLRFGEAGDLEWRDVDSEFDMLQVRDETFVKASLNKDKRQTKSRRSRKIPIHHELASLMKGIPRVGSNILHGPRGGSLRSDVFGDTLRDLVLPQVAEKFENEDVLQLTAHGFRHYFVSKCANLGVPQLSVMNWLGHKTPRMTNYYYHANDAASLMHMRQLEAAEVSDQCEPGN